MGNISQSIYLMSIATISFIVSDAEYNILPTDIHTYNKSRRFIISYFHYIFFVKIGKRTNTDKTIVLSDTDTFPIASYARYLSPPREIPHSKREPRIE